MSLQRYIDQLLEDIQVATENVPEPWSPADEEVDEEFGLLPWMEDPENAPTKSLEEWTTLKKEQFPPENRLTDRQVEVLLKAVKNMLDHYNCSAVFQIEVPPRIQYRVIRTRFQQEVPMLKANYYFFEFCDKKDNQDRSTCILGEKYCHCAFFEAFFDRFEDDQASEEMEQIAIDPSEEYMLKRRYGESWYKYLPFEEDLDYDDYSEEDDLDEGFD
ncbi:MAG: hypothetical protein AAGJ18_30315, partial [Bacteroidota bacterium]